MLKPEGREGGRDGGREPGRDTENSLGAKLFEEESEASPQLVEACTDMQSKTLKKRKKQETGRSSTLDIMENLLEAGRTDAWLRFTAGLTTVYIYTYVCVNVCI